VIQERLFNLLSGFVGGRMYPNIAPGAVQKPYMVYTRVASQPEVTLNSKQPIQNTRLQIDCFDNSYEGVQTLARQVNKSMEDWETQNVPLLEQDRFDSDANLHRVILDFSIWHYD
jgi:hypothetical protein